ncbi:hypothetical protein [Nonomuraea cavernae]|uniref:Uncharacterized protein n=1 Tax=Nonomuraea cavernae TaxID=2045107 RepID=A0A918DGE1_9ACTN|nr:hypothetical protein [Nonomuraea cavernae]MCA2184723.1 hypothetical protein [Nonomuraea cavernae]GGO62953.1 hypothetical protein GCM10012289_08730 [Nonomuraea cavernae]
MIITAPPAEADPPATAEIAETMLSLLRRLANAKARRILPDQYDSVTDQLIESLAALLQEFDWPRGMALEAINYAMTNGTTMRDAMYATQTG